MRLRTRTLKKARIEIIPMIDVIFFLLVFFMISSLANIKTHQIAVNLPKVASHSQSITPHYILTIKKDGAVFVNSTPTQLENLGSLLSYEMRSHPDEAVIIKADQGVAYGSVIAVMEKAKNIGVRKFSLISEASQKAHQM